MENLKEMSNEELDALMSRIKEEIKIRNLAEPTKELFDPTQHFERYNGGWTKTITALDKSKTNGYSLLGDFMPRKVDWYYEGILYLDCGIGGSRKNWIYNYTLFTFNHDGKIDVLETIECYPSYHNWATDLWGSIEKKLV